MKNKCAKESSRHEVLRGLPRLDIRRSHGLEARPANLLDRSPDMDRNTPKLATVFGGSGFVGTHLIPLRARQGYRVRVAVRRPDLAGTVRVAGGVGQVVPVQANLRNEDSIRRAVVGADVVINLVGIGYE